MYRLIFKAPGGAMAIVILTLMLAVLTACTPEIRTAYVVASLTHGPRPVLPKIKEEELTCISDATYQKLYDRQRLITDYAVELEAIIDGTQDKNNTPDNPHLGKP